MARSSDPPPLDDVRIAEIRESVEHMPDVEGETLAQLAQIFPLMLDQIDWLTKRYDAMREQSARIAEASDRRNAELQSFKDKMLADFQRADQFIDDHRHPGSGESEPEYEGAGYPDGDPDARHSSWYDRCQVMLALRSARDAEDEAADARQLTKRVFAGARSQWRNSGASDSFSN